MAAGGYPLPSQRARMSLSGPMSLRMKLADPDQPFAFALDVMTGTAQPLHVRGLVVAAGCEVDDVVLVETDTLRSTGGALPRWLASGVVASGCGAPSACHAACRATPRTRRGSTQQLVREQHLG